MAAPPVYRPQQASRTNVQLKPAGNFRTETRPAPQVYRSKQFQTGLQPKLQGNFRIESRPAPPVYRPERTHNAKVQAKPSGHFRIGTSPAHPACRPQQLGISATQQKVPAASRATPHGSIYIPLKPASIQLKAPSAIDATRVIQRMRGDPVERAKAEMRARQQKKKNMAEFAQGYQHLYRQPKNSPEMRMVNSLSFGGNRSSAALITSASGDTIYVAEQHGGASKAPQEIWDLSGAEVIASDSECSSGLHSEMQTIVALLREWKESGHEYQQFEINTAEDFLVSRIGGGKAVAKGKGCCQLCAAILLKLGVQVAFIEPSQYESTWQDPFEFVELENPWF